MAGVYFVVERCLEDAAPALDILRHTLLRFYLHVFSKFLLASRPFDRRYDPDWLSYSYLWLVGISQSVMAAATIGVLPGCF